MFVNFDNVLQTTRRKLPFGIAQQGNLSVTRSPPATSFSAAASSNRWKWNISLSRAPMKSV